MTTMTASSSLRLYDLPDAIREAMDRAVDPETGEINELLEGELDALVEAFDAKAEYIALLSREAKAEAAAVKQEEDRLRARRTAAQNREARLKAYLLACMTRMGVPRIEGQRAKIRVQESPPSVRWMGDPEAIPEGYRRVTIAPDLSRAKEEMKAGAELPDGFTVERGSHVRVY